MKAERREFPDSELVKWPLTMALIVAIVLTINELSKLDPKNDKNTSSLVELSVTSTPETILILNPTN